MITMKNRLAIMLILLSMGHDTFSAELDLNSYRKQVESVDPHYQSAQSQVKGAQAVHDSYENSTDAQLVARTSYGDDRRPTLNPDFQGDRTMMRTLSLGVQQQTSWGPRFEFTQNVVQTRIENASPAAVPLSDFYDSYPKIDVTVPLWRNFMGHQIRIEQKIKRGHVQERILQSEMRWIHANGTIEMTFYSYLAATEQYQMLKEILQHAEKILKWTTTRAQRGLSDSADIFQAEAAVKARQLELEDALANLQAIGRRFNSRRGIQSEQVSEILLADDLPMSKLLLDGQVNKVSRNTSLNKTHTLVQEQTYLSLRQLSLPQLDLNLSAQWNGRDPELSPAIDETFDSNQSNFYIGLQFTMPLDVPKYLRVERGLLELSASEKLRNAAEQRDGQVEWENFVARGTSLYKQVSILRELEVTQKQKADAERARLVNGRSTTFQVLSFEQDYISTRSRRISAELQARQYIVELPLYE